MAEDLPETIKQELTKTIQKEFNIQNFSLIVTEGTTKGDNFLGICYRVTVKSKNLETSLFVKIGGTDPLHRGFLQTRICFLREIDVYENIIPRFYKILDKAAVEFNFAPKLYGSVGVELEEALFMEDLKNSGFSMTETRKELNLVQCEKAIEALAKFHAVSFKMKKDYLADFKRIQNYGDIFLMNPDSPRARKYAEDKVNEALDCLDPNEDKIVYEKMKKMLSKSFSELYAKGVDSSGNEPYSTLCHGDFWKNNILFKYGSDENGTAIDEVKIVDYQLARYAPPTTDLSYFILCCTTRDFRRKHLDNLLDHYHKHFSLFTQKLGDDPSEVFPKEVFLKQFFIHAVHGLLLAIMVLPAILGKMVNLPSDDAPEQGLIGEEFQKFQSIMREIMYDVVELKIADNFMKHHEALYSTE